MRGLGEQRAGGPFRQTDKGRDEKDAQGHPHVRRREVDEPVGEEGGHAKEEHVAEDGLLVPLDLRPFTTWTRAVRAGVHARTPDPRPPSQDPVCANPDSIRGTPNSIRASTARTSFSHMTSRSPRRLATKLLKRVLDSR